LPVGVASQANGTGQDAMQDLEKDRIEIPMHSR